MKNYDTDTELPPWYVLALAYYGAFTLGAEIAIILGAALWKT